MLRSVVSAVLIVAITTAPAMSIEIRLAGQAYSDWAAAQAAAAAAQAAADAAAAAAAQAALADVAVAIAAVDTAYPDALAAFADQIAAFDKDAGGAYFEKYYGAGMFSELAEMLNKYGYGDLANQVTGSAAFAGYADYILKFDSVYGEGAFFKYYNGAFDELINMLDNDLGWNDFGDFVEKIKNS